MPKNYVFPYPSEQLDIKNSILFNKPLKRRLSAPIVEPLDTHVVKKGSTLILVSGESLNCDFKYVLNSDELPSFFTGLLYDAGNPPKIEQDCTVKAVSVARGFFDSEVVEMHYKVSESEIVKRRSGDGIEARGENRKTVLDKRKHTTGRKRERV